MRFSTKVRYGLRAVLEIARTTENKVPMNISSIAETQNLSVKYLETLLLQLKKRDILQSIRGKQGGYLLHRTADSITVLDIFEALDGPLNLVGCEENGEKCTRLCQCSTSVLWGHLTKTLADEMQKISLKDLMDNKKLHGELH